MRCNPFHWLSQDMCQLIKSAANTALLLKNMHTVWAFMVIIIILACWGGALLYILMDMFANCEKQSALSAAKLLADTCLANAILSQHFYCTQAPRRTTASLAR